MGPVDEVLARPFHPYTMGLTNAFPDLARAAGRDRADRRRAARPARAARRLPLRATLSVRDRAMWRRPAAGAGRAGSPRRMLARRKDEADQRCARKSQGGRDMADPRRRNGPHEAFPGAALARRCVGGPQARRARRRRHRPRARRERVRSGCSANPAAARPRPAGCCSSSRPRPRGASPIDGKSTRDGCRARSSRQFRRKAQLVFQNPFDALNPRFTIRRVPVRAADQCRHRPGRSIATASTRCWTRVHMRGQGDLLERFPHQLSGGQLQRIVLARALILAPKFIVADEPVSMLDVSVRAGILNLMREIQPRASASPRSTSRTTCAGALCRAPHAGDVSRRPSWRTGRPSASSRRRCIPTPGRWSPRCRSRASTRTAGRCRSAATCRTRATRPRAAASTTAARSRSSAAATRCRLLREVAPGHRAACHLV